MKKYSKHSSHKTLDVARYLPITVRNGEVQAIENISFETEKAVREYLEKVEPHDETVGYVRINAMETYYLEKDEKQSLHRPSPVVRV